MNFCFLSAATYMNILLRASSVVFRELCAFFCPFSCFSFYETRESINRNSEALEAEMD